MIYLQKGKLFFHAVRCLLWLINIFSDEANLPFSSLNACQHLKKRMCTHLNTSCLSIDTIFGRPLFSLCKIIVLLTSCFSPPLRTHPIEKVCKLENIAVAFPETVPIHIDTLFIMFVGTRILLHFIRNNKGIYRER